MFPLTIILIVLFALLALIGALKGFGRGISAQIVRLITVIAAVLVSIYLARLFNNAAMVWVGNRTPEELVAAIEALPISLGDFAGVLSYLDATTLNYIIAIPLSLVIIPILFVICFLLIKLLLLLPSFLLSQLFGFSKDRNNALTKILGLVLGVVQGVLVAAVILMPVSGALTSATEVITAMQEEPESEEAEILSNFYDNTIKEYAENPMIKTVGALGGKALYQKISTVAINDVEYNMVHAVGEPAVKIGIGVSQLKGWDWKLPTDENEDTVYALITAVDDSDYAKSLITDILVFASKAYEDGAIPLSFEPPMSDVADALFETLGKINNDSLKTDLDTLARAYFTLAKNGVLCELEDGDEDSVRDALAKKYINEDGSETTVVAKAVSILNENPNTTPLVTVLTKLTAAALANSFGGDATALYEDIKTGLNTTIAITKDGKTDEEYKTEVKTSLNTVLQENDINLNDDVLDGMADYINDNYDTLQSLDEDGNHSLSDKEMNDIILSYYDAYLATLENGTEMPDISEIPDISDLPGVNE